MSYKVHKIFKLFRRTLSSNCQVSSSKELISNNFQAKSNLTTSDWRLTTGDLVKNLVSMELLHSTFNIKDFNTSAEAPC